MRDSGTHLRTIANQDGAAILDTKRGMISTLNPTGAYVWQALECGKPVETIIANLAQETGEDSAVVDRDVREFLNTLKQKHLLLH
jgi:6-phosphogluconate dehydrogenase (decarboxylating)